MVLLDGKKLSQSLKLEIKNKVIEHTTQGGKKPHLAAILVGEDGASETYVASKIKSCKEVGFDSTLVRLDAEVSEEKLLSEIEKINVNRDIDGLIVQLPLPGHISVNKITETIAPEKDVDGFHPINVGRMVKGLPSFLPATPFGILQMLERYQIHTSGKHCVVLGRSQIVGTPMSILMARNHQIGNCTVTLCHSKTKDLKKITREADIIIIALGKPGFLKEDMVKEDVIVIDVGITRVSDTTSKKGYRIQGDVDFEGVAHKASYLTPVPGGVGLMTITSLLQNTLWAAQGKIYTK